MDIALVAARLVVLFWLLLARIVVDPPDVVLPFGKNIFIRRD
jgi:hypothetical protein